MPAVLESRPTGSGLAAMSWASVRSGLRHMPALYYSLLAAYLLLTAASFYVDKHSNEGMQILGVDPAAPFPEFLYLTLSSLIEGIFGYFVLTIAAVAMHRFVLLGEVARPAALITSIHVRRFFGALIAITVLACVPVVPAVVLARLVPQLSVIFVLVGFGVAIFLFVRATMVFPAVAIGDFRAGLREQFKASWRQMDGQFWLFFSGVICVAWPFILLFFLLALIGMLALTFGYRDWPDLKNMLSYKLLDDGLISFAIFILDVGLASWLYAWVRQVPEEPAVTS